MLKFIFGSILLPVVFLLAFCVTGTVQAEEEHTTATYKSVTVERVTTVKQETKQVKVEPKSRYSCALVVKNRAKNIPDAKVAVLEDFVAGHLSDAGFTLIAREDVTRALADVVKAGGQISKQDQGMEEGTTAVRLAESLNADYLLNVAISSYGADTIKYSGHDINVTTTIYRLKVSYQLLDAYHGGTLTAGVITSSFTDRQQPGLSSVRENVLDDLLDGAASDMAGMLAKKAKAGVITAASVATSRPADVALTVRVSVANLAIPQVQKNAKGEYVVTGSTQPLEVDGASVTLDGVVVGVTPGPVMAKPGLHKIRLSRALFKDWEATVFVREGQSLSLPMQLTDEGLKQFVDLSAFYADLKQDQALNDAQVKKIEGYAKMLEQSGIRINATTPPNITNVIK